MPAAINWTPELEDGIETAILSGEAIVDICGTDVFPHGEASFWRHMASDEAFESRIARALIIRAHRDVENCRAIAKNATAEDWQVAQLRIRTLQWDAARRNSKKYGDKVAQEISGPDGAPLPAVMVQFVQPNTDANKG